MAMVSEYSDVEYVFEPHSSTMPDVREYVKALWAAPAVHARARPCRLAHRSDTHRAGQHLERAQPACSRPASGSSSTRCCAGHSAQAAFLPILVPNFFLFGLSMSALSEGGQSIRRGKGLMLNSTFPRALLPVAAVYKSLRSFVPAAGVLVVIFPLMGGTFGPGLFVLPLLFTLQIVMNVGIALLVSTYVVFVPDGNNVVQYVSRDPLLRDAGHLSGQPAAGGGQGRGPVATAVPVLRQLPGDPRWRSPEPGAGGAERALGRCACSSLGARVFLRHERQFALHL